MHKHSFPHIHLALVISLFSSSCMHEDQFRSPTACRSEESTYAHTLSQACAHFLSLCLCCPPRDDLGCGRNLLGKLERQADAQCTLLSWDQHLRTNSFSAPYPLEPFSIKFYFVLNVNRDSILFISVRHHHDKSFNWDQSWSSRLHTF
jgi:hypothetical protein